jgi:hypothetical protein
MTTTTFGTLPPDAVILAAFEDRCPEGYSVVLGRSYTRTLDRAGSTVDPIGDWTDTELLGVLHLLARSWEEGDEDAGMLASSLLETLGFEWI